MTVSETYSLRQRIGLAAGPLALVVSLSIPPPSNMPAEAWQVSGIGALMAIWWASEAVPIPVTALLPLLLLSTLGTSSIIQAAAPYANPIIFLFLGGFMIALAVQRWQLHRRIALNVIGLTGTKPVTIIAGFMVATAFLSMWVSNTATTIMMLPIGVSVIGLATNTSGTELAESDPTNFGISLMLGIAYSASIGGMATLIGTPPNALLAGFMLETYGVDIGFAEWMLIGVPLTVILLPITWVILTKVVFPIRIDSITGGREIIADELNRLGPLSKEEKLVIIVFALTALLWLFRSLVNRWIPGLSLSDTSIAIAGAIALFVIPTNLRKGEFLLNWEWAKRLPWDVLILFGGGLSLANAINQTGLDTWIGETVSGVNVFPVLIIVLTITAVIVFLTELTSNTATAAVFLPIIASVAVGMNQSPFLLVVPAALAASSAFMMPVATPPNAIIYGSGMVTIPQMVRAGILMNIVAIFIITALAYALVIAAFDL
ncbi:MAG: SLC13 family permease [Dehalococcoidia bacterium]